MSGYSGSEAEAAVEDWLEENVTPGAHRREQAAGGASEQHAGLAKGFVEGGCAPVGLHSSTNPLRSAETLSCMGAWPYSSDWVADGRGPSEEPQLGDEPEPHLMTLEAGGRGKATKLPGAADASLMSADSGKRSGRQRFQRDEDEDNEDEVAVNKAVTPMPYQIQMPDLGTGDFEDILHAVVWHVGRHFGFQGKSGCSVSCGYYCCHAPLTSSSCRPLFSLQHESSDEGAGEPCHALDLCRLLIIASIILKWLIYCRGAMSTCQALSLWRPTTSTPCSHATATFAGTLDLTAVKSVSQR